ncbi:Gfo/Idh/MocA family oxidoreductase [Streptomyces sp. NPDC048278]|uniref:Gfo/Idh/MocA family protein n=1 Tax=Streptomyces sp. NPDC048278 TaxID=3155809 RepID=UPI003437C83D
MAPVLPPARIIDPASVPALNWGAIGNGWIVRLFTEALHAHTRQRIRAVAGRNAGRAAAFAAELGIDRAHESPQALVADPAIDVVYVGTPHSSHREMALLAIAAGKHVLVEKPLALSAEEGREIASAARAAGVFVMEAMWTRYLPQSDIIRQLLADGALGDVDLVMADFGFVAAFDPAGRMWDPAVGGGALLDAGVYPLSFASSVLGAPSRITASGAMTTTGVDARAVVQLTAAGGANAVVATSMVSALPVRASIVGSAGRIDIPTPFFGPSGVVLTLGSIGSEDTASWTDDRFKTMHEGLSDQANALASYVAEGRTESPLHPLDEAVTVLGTIDEVRRQVASQDDAARGAGTPGSESGV